MIEIWLKTFALIALAYALTTLVFSQKTLRHAWFGSGGENSRP